MKTNKFLELLLEDLAYKKTSFPKKSGYYCDLCERRILKGDEFVFLGDNRRICMICRNDMLTYIEELN